MTSRIAAALGLALLAASAPAPASAAPTISQYQLPSSAGKPLGIASGAEDSLWVALNGGDRAIARISLSGGLTSFAIPGHASPLGIVAGGEDELWFTSSGGDAVLGDLTPSTGAIHELQVTNNSNATGITRGPEGAIWFLLQGGPAAALARVDPLTEQVEQYPIPTANSQPTSLTFGPEGDIFFTETANAGAIGRFDPATGIFARYPTTTPNSHPTGIAMGAEGDIWFTEDTQPGAIGRLVPATGAVEQFSNGPSAGAPLQIVAGSDGDLYFTEDSKGGAIGQITPAGTIAQYSQGMTLDGEPAAITSGPDGNVWFTEQGNPGDVARLTIAPSVTAETATASGAEAATLTASVGANAQETSYYFEYGAAGAPAAHTAPAAAGSADAPAVVAQTVSGLQPQTTYRYRIVATNASGTTYGAESSFSTPAASAHAAASLHPQLGRSAAVVPLAGSVLVKLPRAKHFTALSGARTVPLGSQLNAEHGSVRLLTALNRRGKTQAVRVWGGDFAVAQKPRGNGMTALMMRGARPSCGASAAKRSRRAAASPRLWAEDDHGRYSTHGANSVATVLGTKWETEETCAGTYTFVLRGRVKVRDLRSGRRVVVSAGHGYLARS